METAYWRRDAARFRSLRRRARSKPYIVVPTLRAALPILHPDNARGGRVPAGPVLHRGQGCWDNMGDHARRSPQVRFEDERIMNTLGQFASLAYQTVESIEDLKLQIAAREQAETAVRALASGLEAKVRCLVDSNIIGIFIWNLDGRIIDGNEAFLRIIGYDRGDLIAGRLNWRELTPPEWREAADRRVAQLEASGTTQPHEKEYFRKDGTHVPVLVGAAAFEGRSVEGVGFVLDLTDRK